MEKFNRLDDVPLNVLFCAHTEAVSAAMVKLKKPSIGGNVAYMDNCYNLFYVGIIVRKIKDTNIVSSFFPRVLTEDEVSYFRSKIDMTYTIIDFSI